MRKFVVARADSLQVGERMLVQVNNHAIGVFREADGYYALLNRCPHQGGDLCKGDIVGMLEATEPGDVRFDLSRKFLACPWHGWEFDVRTGQSYLDPTTVRVRPYQVQVEEGQVVVSELDAGQVGVTDGERRPIEQGTLPHPVVPGRLPGPYQAETIPITVEDDYIVVNLDPVRPPRRPKGTDAPAATQPVEEKA